MTDEPPSLEDFDLQNPNENEQYRQEMASYAEWKTEAKKRQDIKSALLGKCNEQVKKNMKREDDEDQKDKGEEEEEKIYSHQNKEEAT